MTARSTGWGRSIENLLPKTSSSIHKISKADITKRGLTPVGLRRSYGDSSLNSGGIELLSHEYNRMELDKENGILNVGSGISISEMSDYCLKHNWYLAVVPGTGQVTAGGAFASDIHGKSHHTNGNFSNYVNSIKVLDSNFNEFILTKEETTSERFWATAGGMGLTGLITELEIQLIPVETSYVKVEEIRVKHLDEMLEKLVNFGDKFLYTVAWIDLSGKYLGKGIVSGGNHALKSEIKIKQIGRPKPVNKFSFGLPDIFPNGLINSLTVRIFNELWYRKPLSHGVVPIQKYMHPLDGVQNWNRLYGKRGFLQYQFVIPFGQEYFLKKVLSVLKEAGIASPLGVLKSFGQQGGGLLSFPKPGWTLAVDIPISVIDSSTLLQNLDEELIELGGRVYLTKDSRLDSRLVKQMYTRLDEWKRIKREMDPENFWQSDQARRLDLC
jgi:decaprenylphospho-beta-D-ribofuranose 2-oxidase